MKKAKKAFEKPICKIDRLDIADVITTSGGFEGEWDLEVPKV